MKVIDPLCREMYLYIYIRKFAFSFRVSEVSGACTIRIPVLTRAGSFRRRSSGVHRRGGCSEQGQYAPDHVVDHPANGNLQGAQRLVGRQDVGQAGEAKSTSARNSWSSVCHSLCSVQVEWGWGAEAENQGREATGGLRAELGGTHQPR